MSIKCVLFDRDGTIGNLVDKKYPEDKIFVAGDINEALNHVYALNSQGKKKIILLENDLPDNY